jgi:hypothetical protein
MPQRLADILGALAAGVVRSERHSADATLDFLRTVGFEGGKGDDWGDVRYIRFSYSFKDPAGAAQSRTIRVPLLSLVPLPLQQAASAEYEFFLKLSDIDLQEKSDKEGYVFRPYAELIGDIAPYVTDSSMADARTPRIRVKFALRQSDLPAGIASTLRRVEETSGEA